MRWAGEDDAPSHLTAGRGVTSPAGDRRAGLRASATTYLLLSFLQRGAALLLLPFVTRVMLPAEYGAVSVVVAGGGLVTVALGAALEPAVFRWAAKPAEESAGVLRLTAIYLGLILPALGAGIALALWLFDSQVFGVPDRVWAVEILAAGFIPFVSYFALPHVRGTGRLRPFIAVSLTSILALTGAKVLLVISLGLGLWGWVLSDLAGALIGFVVALVIVRPPRGRVSGAMVKQVFRFSLPLWPHNLSFWALTSLSRPAMAAITTLSQVGLYSLALNVANVGIMVLGEVNRAVLGDYSREEFPAPSDRVRHIARAQVLAAFVVPTGLASAVVVGAPLLFGPEFQKATPLIGILVLSQIAYGLYLIPMNFIVQTAGRTTWSWIASTIGAAVIFVSIVISAQRYGAVGVSIGTVLGYFAMWLIALALARIMRIEVAWRRLAPPWWTLVVSAVAVVVACLALVLALPHPWLIAFAIVALALAASTLVYFRRDFRSEPDHSAAQTRP